MPKKITENNNAESYNLENERKNKVIGLQHLFFLLSLWLLTGVFLWHYSSNSLFVGEGLVINPELAVNSPLKLNPNTATWEELALLPGIGPAKAKAIVKYRQEQQQYHVNEGDIDMVFKSATDMSFVPGIGSKTVESLQDNLIFQ
ncbi:MAG: helix-hairpin-helix domain-containing protein [Sedimentisphaerales bacterium]|nr:helix-hairpin-helix domain-containing protein [Sedimentisphaerales bacterium]MBN2843025.1 helix-hairpin-helix domain-containing protein [Sedimentisphaerales bacterium]